MPLIEMMLAMRVVMNGSQPTKTLTADMSMLFFVMCVSLKPSRWRVSHLKLTPA